MNKLASVNGLVPVIVFAAVLAGCQATPAIPPEPQVMQPEPAAVQQSDAQAQAEKPADPAESHYQLAMWAARAGKREDALFQFRKVIGINPLFRRAYTNLGLLLLQSGDREEARQALEKAIEQDNSDAIAYNHLAIIQRNEGQFQKALSNYRKAIEVDPDYANAHLNLGILLDIYLQDLPVALQHYETFQRLTGGGNETVEKWVIDIKRRIDNKGNRKG